jgi:hypothetical protein
MADVACKDRSRVRRRYFTPRTPAEKTGAQHSRRIFQSAGEFLQYGRRGGCLGFVIVRGLSVARPTGASNRTGERDGNCVNRAGTETSGCIA